MHKPAYIALIFVTVLATLGGIITLVPWPRASYPNLIGYSSVCPFTPAATFFCFLIAGVSCFLRSTFVKDASGSSGERFQRHAKRLIPLVLVLTLALFFTYQYTEVKSRYTDGSTAATEE